jgi:agmatinase
LTWRPDVGPAGRCGTLGIGVGMNVEFSGQRNFLGLAGAFCSREASYFHIIPVPYDATSTYGVGSRVGPRAIIDASMNLETYDHELDMEPARVGVFTHPEVRVSVGDPAIMIARIEQEVAEVTARGKFPIVLGGEHTVSLGAIRALARREKFAVVSLDAHADLRDTYQGSPLSHACFLRRAMESADCRAIGVRSISKEEMEFARQADVPVVFAHRLADNPEIDLSSLPERIYVSIDIDVLDPSVMPSTGTPEPGGLSWYGVNAILRSLVADRRVVGFDLVELCPQPGNHGPDFTAAKLIYRMMGLVLRSSPMQGEDWKSHGEEEAAEEKAG